MENKKITVKPEEIRMLHAEKLNKEQRDLVVKMAEMMLEKIEEEKK